MNCKIHLKNIARTDARGRSAKIATRQALVPVITWPHDDRYQCRQVASYADLPWASVLAFIPWPDCIHINGMLAKFWWEWMEQYHHCALLAYFRLSSLVLVAPEDAWKTRTIEIAGNCVDCLSSGCHGIRLWRNSRTMPANIGDPTSCNTLPPGDSCAGHEIINYMLR